MRSLFKQQKTFKIIVLPLLLAFMAFFLIFFLLDATQKARANSNGQLKMSTNQVSYTIKVKIEDSLHFIESSSKAFSTYEDLHSKKALNLLHEMAENKGFTDLWLSTTDGTAISSNADVSSVSSRGYFESAKSGISGISDRFLSLNDHLPIFVIYSPIYYNGQFNGMLHGTFDIQDFSNCCKLTSFDGLGYTNVFQTDGSPVLIAKKDHIFKENTSVYQFFKNVKFHEKNAYDTFYRNVHSGKDGYFYYKQSNQAYYAYYAPTGIKDWYTLTIIPDTVVLSHLRELTRPGILLSIELLIIMLIIIFVALRFENVSSKRTTKAYRDLNYLTNNLPGGIQKCSADRKCELLYVSEGFLHMSGYTQEDLQTHFNNRFINTVYAEDRCRIVQELSTLFQNPPLQTVVNLEYRLITKSNHVLWVSDRRQLCIESDEKYIYCMILDITERKMAEEAFKISSEQYKIAVSHMDQAVFEFNPNENLITCTGGNAARYGLPERIEHAPESLLTSDFITESSKKELKAAFDEIQNKERFCMVDIQVLQRDNQPLWNQVSLTNIFDQSGDSVKTIIIVRDITKEKLTELKLKEETQYRGVVLAETIFVYEFNLTMEKVKLRHTSLKASKKFHEENYCYTKQVNPDLIHPKDKDRYFSLFSVSNLLSLYHQGTPELKIQLRIKNKKENWTWVELTLRFLTEGDSPEIKAAAYMKDIDQEKRVHSELKSKAERDAMTGLYNRTTIQEKIDGLLSQNLTKQHAFLIFDVDYFKTVNDTLGHLSGDLLLKTIAKMLKAQCRNTDLLGRLGGDEFLVFLRETSGEDFVIRKAERIRERVHIISEQLSWSLPISISMGIAIAPKDGTTFDTLYRKADQALYHAKRTGRNRFVLYEPELFSFCEAPR